MQYIRFVSASAVLLVLGGCAATPSALEAEPEPSTEPTTAAPTLVLNTHDAVDVALGESVVINFPGTDRAGVSFKFTQIDTAVQCTGEFAFPAPAGQWLAVHFEVTTTDDYEILSGNQPMRFFGNDFFTSSSADGALVGSNGMSGCIEGDDAVLDVPAGTTTQGILVLNAPADATSLVWEESTFVLNDIPRYEWSLL